MIQTNWFGRGFRLRTAITIACQLAFVLFGYDQVCWIIVLLRAHTRASDCSRSKAEPGNIQGVFSGIVGNANWLDQFGHPVCLFDTPLVLKELWTMSANLTLSGFGP